ncbi:hypothetical protein BKA65DRAFT_491565 [Rhexocercosporidium sp. MPI-PUGE-AT-0058]|nr:hypothetical protein BKA65DRAFT_491565 [Rhexocercosporidium sp. MPI-PUGE-AT-0058]
MTFQYRFTHTCGHTGFGPIVNQQQASIPTTSLLPFPSLNTTTIPLPLLFPCPFCNPSTSNLLPHTPPGSGLLTILNSTPTSPFPTGWTVLKACGFEELEPRDWNPALEGGLVDGRFRQMAWIARPCGEVRMEELEEGRVVVKVGMGWRLRGGVGDVG